MKVLLTGANGFVGKATSAALEVAGHFVVPAVRVATVPGQVSVGNIGGQTDWGGAIAGCHAVVHLAGRAHVTTESEVGLFSLYREVNTAGTLNLALQAAKAGVRRFVFVSSIKVLGEETVLGQRFTADDRFAPQDAYGMSKSEAELGLRQIAADTGLEVVIVRPPLVYGPGVKGNFAALMRWLQRGWPAPLGAVTHNRRSLVALDNLVDLIATCIDHPRAANEAFLAGDGEDLSTTELLRRTAIAMDVPVRQLPVPVWLLMAGARAVRKEAIMRRLCGNLQVDISKTRQVLGWSPPIDVDEGLRLAASDFRR